MRKAFLILFIVAIIVTITAVLVSPVILRDYFYIDLFTDTSVASIIPPPVVAMAVISHYPFNVDKSNYLSLTADKFIYAVGEPATITLKNISTSKVSFSCHMYNFYILSTVPPKGNYGICYTAMSHLTPNQEFVYLLNPNQKYDYSMDLSSEGSGFYRIISTPSTPDDHSVYINIMVI